MGKINIIKKASLRFRDALKKIGNYLLFQPLGQVPSAQVGLTSLFGMGRGDHHRYCHLKYLYVFTTF